MHSKHISLLMVSSGLVFASCKGMFSSSGRLFTVRHIHKIMDI